MTNTAASVPCISSATMVIMKSAASSVQQQERGHSKGWALTAAVQPQYSRAGEGTAPEGATIYSDGALARTLVRAQARGLS